MFLVNLIYASTAKDVSLNQVREILKKAQKNNSEKNVSGILCFSNNYFLQSLEGSRSNVNYIYHKILKDERHCNPIILSYSEVSVRLFPDWNMKYVENNKISNQDLLSYSIGNDFNPYQMSGESALAFLKSLSVK